MAGHFFSFLILTYCAKSVCNMVKSWDFDSFGRHSNYFNIDKRGIHDISHNQIINFKISVYLYTKLFHWLYWMPAQCSSAHCTSLGFIHVLDANCHVVWNVSNNKSHAMVDMSTAMYGHQSSEMECIRLQWPGPVVWGTSVLVGMVPMCPHPTSSHTTTLHSSLSTVLSRQSAGKVLTTR